VILVGDPGRVELVSSHFDLVEIRKGNREFVTHTGRYQGKRISVLSTGIGTDNIDIVLNELDALANIDLKIQLPKPEHKQLNLIRLGTSGALQRDIQPGTQILSYIAGGFDGLYHFYKEETELAIPGLADAFMNYMSWPSSLPDPYFVQGSDALLQLLSEDHQVQGITISTPGFYAPQARSLRLSPFDSHLIQKATSFTFNGWQINNFEMESSALYALSALLGHRAITLCVAIANRISQEYLTNYQPAIEKMIVMVLDKLAQYDRA
jgi:uridine phosphorylase